MRKSISSRIIETRKSLQKEVDPMKKLIALVLAATCIGGSSFAMTFTSFDTVGLFSNNKAKGAVQEKITKAPNGEKVAFVYQGTYLKLMSADKTHDYLSFISNNGTTATFRVKSLTTVDPAMKLWEVKARGTDMHGYANEGYWLVGLKNNKYVTYISQDSLNEMGYGKNPQYSTYALRTQVINGHYYIDAGHARTETTGSTELRTILDFSVRADWDDQAQWFKLYYKNL